MAQSPNTGATHVEPQQNQKEATINNGFDRISRYVSGLHNVNRVDPSPTATEFRQAIVFNLDYASLVNSSYQWTASGSGTAEYYLEISGGGNPGITQPDKVDENESSMSVGTLGSLAQGEYAWGDNDSLGYSTLYVRLSDDTDPDTKTDDYIEATVNTVIFPNSINKLFVVQNVAHKDIQFDLDGVGSPITITLGNNATFYSDGTDLSTVTESGIKAPFDLSFFKPGQFTDSELVLIHSVVRSLTLPAGLSGSTGYADTPPSGSDQTLDLQKNGVSVGSVTFAVGTNSPTFSMASETSLTSGDRLAIVGDATADSNFADVALTLKGSKT